MDLALALGFAAAAVAFFAGGFLLLTARGEVPSRVLGLLLIAESLFQLAFALSDTVGSAQPGLGENFVALGFGAALTLNALYPWLLRTLDTPFTRLFRRRGFLLPYTAILLADAVVFLALFFGLGLTGHSVGEDSPVLLLAIPAFFGVMLLSALALAASIHAFRRARPGPTRERARAFMIAFGARDLLFVLAIVLNIASDAFDPAPRRTMLDLSGYFNTLGTLVYVPLLVYGILKAQLFDIDLKLKVGLRRSTVVTVALIVVLAAAKVAEFYLNKTYGFVAGGIAAGMMLVLTPRLNKMGEKVANTAMPQVQPTPAYVQFKKLEVYRAAVESAHETGGIDDRQRATLERLRGKLGLAAEDCAAVEAEVTA